KSYETPTISDNNLIFLILNPLNQTKQKIKVKK
ncbi:hypothetical protein, partial [uncultured Gammaproteobacteria bacterium]